MNGSPFIASITIFPIAKETRTVPICSGSGRCPSGIIFTTSGRSATWLLSGNTPPTTVRILWIEFRSYTTECWEGW